MRGGRPIFVLTALALGLVAARLVALERTEGPALRARAARQQHAEATIPARRGDVLDCRGRVMAATVRKASVFADPALVRDFAFDAAAVAEPLGLDEFALERELLENTHRRFLWVKRRISADEETAFKLADATHELTGFGLIYEPTRVYPLGPLAAQVLGFVNAEQRGAAGVEQAFDEQMRGAPGRRQSTVDVGRRRIAVKEGGYQPPVDGASVVLTIDAHLQQRAESHVSRMVREFDAEWGVAVLLDPHTGEVLACAAAPSFDPRRPVPPGADAEQVEAALELTRNRAIADAYEPGSIFKPFIAAPAMQAGFARIDEAFAINGPTHVFGRRVIHDTHEYDTLTLAEIVSHSSNIGMGLIGARCGNARLYEFVRRFGFGDPTGVRLPGEHAGLLRPLESWGNYSTQSIPIGQELAVTPLQVAAAFAVFCNDGVLMRPRFVRGLVGPDGATVEDYSRPVAIRRVLEADVAREFRLRALVDTVNNGTGKRAQLDKWQVFGKTGTAQVAAPDGRGYIPRAYVGSFVAGAPAADPRLTVVVTLYRPNPSRAYYGGTVAAPTAAAILADALEYLHVPPDR
ncbi:MAG: penicillin-binding protein 2 [Planctomycetota bacterium]|nr:MAG: penicillin-binding protein 2 [Planctomycetota bacterium]